MTRESRIEWLKAFFKEYPPQKRVSYKKLNDDEIEKLYYLYNRHCLTHGITIPTPSTIQQEGEVKEDMITIPHKKFKDLAHQKNDYYFQLKAKDEEIKKLVEALKELYDEVIFEEQFGKRMDNGDIWRRITDNAKAALQPYMK